MPHLAETAEAVAAALKARETKIVFAESCTGGKMAAAMTAIPGISAHFCGSAVTYREQTKTVWLGIFEADLEKYTAESEATTLAMAKEVLTKTPEADVAVAITGHLGPGVNEDIDGKIFTVLAARSGDLISNTHRLTGIDRRERQTEAAQLALQEALAFLSASR